VSVVSEGFARAGFTTNLVPPRPGLYYSAVATYNPLAQVFTIQNGVNQNSLAAQTAQLYSEPTTGSPMVVQAPTQSYPYGAWLGPVSAVWFEPTETPGSYPVTLGALAGLVQWTPTVTLGADSQYVVPGAPITSVVITNATDTSATITVTGTLSHSVVGSLALGGSASATIPLEAGTGDSVFAITSDRPLTATISLFVGVAPVVTGGGSLVPVYYASLTGPGETASPGDLTQRGGFTVIDSIGDGITFTSAGNTDIESVGTIDIGTADNGGDISIGNINRPASINIRFTNSGGGGLLFNAATGEISIDTTGDIEVSAGGLLHLLGADVEVTCNNLGFFTAAPVPQQVSGGTLAGLIAGLVALGLFSS
jgi:hypothetical protein